jgi:hypothetical protein
MDGSSLYKDGWHPMVLGELAMADNLCLSRKRSEVEIKYYFIDFRSIHASLLQDNSERLVTGGLGRIKAPEQISGLPYDPFKLDTYYLRTCLSNEDSGRAIPISFMTPPRSSCLPTGVQRIGSFG